MIKIRLIPTLLLKKGHLVRSENFIKHNIIGDPYHEVKRFNQWNVDELIYLIIDEKPENTDQSIELLKNISKSCFMPLTFGGQIKSMNDIHLRFQNGADKITLNTYAYKKPDLVMEASKVFGKQAIVGSIDYRDINGEKKIFINVGKTLIDISPIEWAKELEKLGVGEILLQNIDRDGTAVGYDVETIELISSNLNIPVIALSGVGKFEHYVDGVKAGASAVSAANIWHFKEMADHLGKTVMRQNKIPIRIG